MISSTNKYLDLVGSPGRYPTLDGLRGLAIIAVLLRHAVHGWHQPLEGLFWNPWHNGWLGVELFFALSGFLIAHHLISWWPSEEFSPFIRAYFSKRALRIVPIYIASILIATLGLIPLYEPPKTLTTDIIVVHILFVQEYFYSSIVVPLWSVGVEEKFYLLAPVIALGVMHQKRRHFLYLLGYSLAAIFTIKAISIVVSPPNSYSQYFWQYRAPFHYSAANILPGVAVAILMHTSPHFTLTKVTLRHISTIALVVLGLLILPFNLHETKQWLAVDIAALLCSICFAILIYCGTHSGLIFISFFESRFLRFFARISFPLYATHIMFVPLSVHVGEKLRIESEPMSFIAFFGTYIFTSLTAASIMHLAIEKPFLLIKESVQYRTTTSPSSA